MSQDIQYFNNESEMPPFEPARKQRGCLFWGCLASIIVSILVVILLGVLFFFVMRILAKFVEEYSEDKPQPIATAELAPDELKALKDRFDAFNKSLLDGEPTEPMVLTAKEVNALISTQPEWKGVIAFDFVGDKIQGDIAFPLELVGFPGRFFNAEGTFTARIQDDGLLEVKLDSAKVKGQAIPDEGMKELRKQNLAKDFNTKPEYRKYLARIDSIKVKDGKLYVYPRLRSDAAAKDEKKADDKKPEPSKDAKKAEEKKPEPPKDETKPAPKEDKAPAKPAEPEPAKKAA